MEFEARRFLESSYDLNDKWAKDLIIPYLVKKGYKIIDTKEDFEHDIKTLNSDNKEVLFEIEVKTGYSFTNRESFPYDTVSFTGRKERLHKSKPFFYIIICRETQWAVTAFSDDIYVEKNIETFHINSEQREGLDSFYRLSKDKCSFFRINVDPIVQLKTELNYILNSSIGLKISKHINNIFQKKINDLFSRNNVKIDFTLNWQEKEGCIITGVQNVDEEIIQMLIEK